MSIPERRCYNREQFVEQIDLLLQTNPWDERVSLLHMRMLFGGNWGFEGFFSGRDADLQVKLRALSDRISTSSCSRNGVNLSDSRACSAVA